MIANPTEHKNTPAPERRPFPVVPENSDVEIDAPIENAEQAGEQESTPAENRPQITTSAEKTTLRRKPVVTLPATRDPVVLKIEKIMESGVGDAYNRLSPIAKQEFKIKGEQTAIKISNLLKSTHIKVKKIFQLIMEWLKLLPGVNHFFLEQEAKIKTDRIIGLHQPKK